MRDDLSPASAVMFGLVLFSMFYVQVATAPGSQYVGHWQGTLTYQRSDEGWPTEVEITNLVIGTDLRVTGTFGKPAYKAPTRIGGDRSTISPDGKFDRIMFWIEDKPAFMQFGGTTKLSENKQCLNGVKIIVVDTGRSPGNSDDQKCEGTLTLHRKSPGA